MRRCIATGLAAIIVAAASVGKARAFERPAVEASWEEQARAMGYLILHLSSVNAINGLNLSRDQAVRLRGMARDVEASGAKVPKLKPLAKR